jgi:hypothetical protein
MIRGTARRPIPRRADPPSAFRLVFGRSRLHGSISPAAAQSIAQAITTQEGFYPGSLSYQNNNPGNLVYAGQPGATLGAGGFASFATLADGQAALVNQITLDATRGTDINGNPTTTVAELLTSWAPPSQNDTSTYIANVTNATGFDPNAPLSTLDASADSSGFALDLGNFASSVDSSLSTMPTVDLSGLGISAPVALPILLGGVVLAVVFLSNR